MKYLILVVGLLSSGTAVAQYSGQPKPDLSYNYLELRFVDVDTNSGDGFRFNGSYDLGNNWLIVGGLTSLDFNNNVDATLFEVGAGYVWSYSEDFDLVSTLRYINADVGNSAVSIDDDGLAFSAGIRGMLAPQFELRGNVHHVTIGNSDSYLELAGDYYFAPQFAAGVSLEFAGDDDVVTVGGRWFFK